LLVALAAREHLGEGGFARPVRPHDGMHFAGLYRQADAFQDVFVLNADFQVFDV
jgi:hypothetical protein